MITPLKLLMRRVFYLFLLSLMFATGLRAQMTNNIPNYLYSGSLGVGRNVANDANVYLQIGPNGSGTKGVLLPRVADTSAVSGTKRNGLLIYSNQLGSFAYYDSTSAVWRKLGFTDTTVISTKANVQKVVNDTAAALRSLVGTRTDTTTLATRLWAEKAVDDSAAVLRSAIGSAAPSLSALTAANSANTINNVNNAQEWQWGSLSATSGLKMSSSSTANSSTGNTLLSIVRTGSNLGTGTFNKGIDISISSTVTDGSNIGVQSTTSGSSSIGYAGLFTASGFATTNYAGFFSASNGSNNYALFTNNGKILFKDLISSGARFVKSNALGVLYTSDTISASSVAISGLTAATGANTINNANNAQEWQWNSLTSSGLKISSNSTAGTNNGKLFEIDRTGTNASSSITTYGIYSSVSNSGTTSTNVGGYFTASGASTNYALLTGGSRARFDASAELPNSSELVLGAAPGSDYGDYKIQVVGNIYQATGNAELASLKANSFAPTILTKTADYTATEYDYTLLVDASGGSKTITLPSAFSALNRIYVIKKKDSSGNSVTVDGNGSETIDGATTYVMSAQNKYVTIQSDGVSWFVIGNN